MTNTQLTWTTQQRKINDLIPYDKNPRKLTKDQEHALKKSLTQFNLVEIPAIDTDNKILAGHQRLKVLQILGRGEEVIDVRVPNRKLTQDEYDRYLVTSNAVTGEWDFVLLKDFNLDMLIDIGLNDITLSKTFDHIKIENNSLHNFDEDEELKKIKTPQTQLGDIILLGKHKLICGDSNNPAVLQKLFGEEKASMIYSDPIYNINLDYNKGLGGKQNYGADVEDNRTTEQYIEFLRKNMTTALRVTKPDAHVFYWNTEQHIWIIQTLYNDLGIKNKRVCLWIKNGHNPTPQVAFNKCYEPCVYGTLGRPFLSKTEQGLTEIMNGEITTGNQSLDDINLWTSKRVSSDRYKHATTKPVELHYRAIKRCTRPNDIVLDSFGGSGSTLAACHNLNRRCYSVEKEPVFCDLIIKRYEMLTNDKAVIVKDYEKDTQA